MALSPKDEDELFDLLSHGWDKQFSAEDLAKLEAFVRKHGEPACELLIEFSSLHVELGSIVAASRAYERAIAAVHAETGDSEERPFEEARRSVARRRECGGRPHYQIAAGPGGRPQQSC